MNVKNSIRRSLRHGPCAVSFLVMRLALVFGVAALAGLSSAAVIVVDDFSVDMATLSRTTTGSSSNNGAISFPTPIGATVTQTLTIVQNDVDEFDRGFSRVRNGIWTLGSDPQVDAQGKMTYVSTYDFSQSRIFKYTFDYIENGTTFNLKVKDGAANEITLSNLYTGASGAAQVYFDLGNVGTFNYGNVTEISTYNTADRGGIDFRLTAIEVVPEPTSIAALGLGLLAVARRRKK